MKCTSNCPPQQWEAIIQDNQPRGGKFYMITLDVPQTFPVPIAGSFLMMEIGQTPFLLLRRPMAFYNVRRKRRKLQIDILYAIAGKGTRQMTLLRRGQCISVLGPLGSGFLPYKKGDHVAIVAGGVGISPFLLWSRQLTWRDKKNVVFYLGFQDSSPLSIAKDFRKAHAQVKIAVEQACSNYFHGTVVDLFEQNGVTHPIDRILTCGPNPMMERVCSIAKQLEIPCEVSLEAKMGCGVGACLSCVPSFPWVDADALACQEGPVFEITP